MSASRLRRTYLLRGLDRVLYSTQPRWRVGTFEQVQIEEGRLILQSGVLSSAAELDEEKKAADRVAEQFRLAIAKRTGCPLLLILEKSEEPSFDSQAWSGRTTRSAHPIKLRLAPILDFLLRRLSRFPKGPLDGFSP